METFSLPNTVDNTQSHRDLAKDLIAAWRRDGIFQVAVSAQQDRKTARALAASRNFFRKPPGYKAGHVSDLTYSGYIASGEEVTAGENDYSEIFTVCKDVPLHDPRVKAQWPCHGPAPWPDEEYRQSMTEFMDGLGEIGEKLLRLTALGLALPAIDALTSLTRDGWHHMRVLRFPTASSKTARGIGAHTDYGLLVIAAQDDVGGLYIRPPVPGEQRNRNWLATESMAGMYENDEPWRFVKPQPSVVTVFPGDILQFLTDGYLLSTPHKVKLNTRERFALAYFHEPNFKARVRPLLGACGNDCIQYGLHFSNMFMRSYPQRITTQRIVEEKRLQRFFQLTQNDGAGSYIIGSEAAAAPRYQTGYR